MFPPSRPVVCSLYGGVWITLRLGIVFITFLYSCWSSVSETANATFTALRCALALGMWISLLDSRERKARAIASLCRPVDRLRSRYETVTTSPSRFQPLVRRSTIRSTLASVSVRVARMWSRKRLGIFVQGTAGGGRVNLILGMKEFFRG